MEPVKVRTPAELEPKKRKRLFIDDPVIIKGKRSVKNPFVDYVEAPVSRRSFGGPDDVALAEQKEADAEDAATATAGVASGDGSSSSSSSSESAHADGNGLQSSSSSSSAGGEAAAAESTNDVGEAQKNEAPVSVPAPVLDPVFAALKFITSGEPFMEIVIEAVRVQ